MRVTGHNTMMKQLSDLPKEAHEGLAKSIERTAKSGARKARSIVPDVTGDLKRGINHKVLRKPNAIIGFINFYEGADEDGLAANAINYGWGDMKFGYQFRETVKMIIGDRHKRAVKRNIDKAIKKAMT
mgnify:FL=1